MTARMRSDELWPRPLIDHLDHVGDGIGASVTPARRAPGSGPAALGAGFANSRGQFVSRYDARMVGGMRVRARLPLSLEAEVATRPWAGISRPRHLRHVHVAGRRSVSHRVFNK